MDYEYDLSQPVFDIVGATTIADLASTQNLHVLVSSYDESTLIAHDPTATTPYIALVNLPEEKTDSITFTAGDWLTESTNHYIRIIVGPSGAIEPSAVGDYAVYIKLGTFIGRAGVISFI